MIANLSAERAHFKKPKFLAMPKGYLLCLSNCFNLLDKHSIAVNENTFS